MLGFKLIHVCKWGPTTEIKAVLVHCLLGKWYKFCRRRIQYICDIYFFKLKLCFFLRVQLTIRHSCLGQSPGTLWYLTANKPKPLPIVTQFADNYMQHQASMISLNRTQNGKNSMDTPFVTTMMLCVYRSCSQIFGCLIKQPWSGCTALKKRNSRNIVTSLRLCAHLATKWTLICQLKSVKLPDLRIVDHIYITLIDIGYVWLHINTFTQFDTFINLRFDKVV